ncbi:MAG TPA: hypothetical protein PKC18_07910, partial [Lacipirellulaceae bacterium]|nr:hypothetical protein [Lacipirellulaceae bacterium]
MTAAQRLALVALAASLFAPAALRADEVSYVDEGGIRYQVTKRTVQRQVPVTEMSEQTQTYYRQQVTSDTLQHQQLYSVPVTQYQLVSRMHGRWNPFVTPYWTHHYEPVTTWTQQTGMVSIPINRVSWAPETRTVQAPTTTYRLANEEMVTRVAIGPTPSGNRSTMVAAAGPSALLAAGGLMILQGRLRALGAGLLALFYAVWTLALHGPRVAAVFIQAEDEDVAAAITPTGEGDVPSARPPGRLGIGAGGEGGAQRTFAGG